MSKRKLTELHKEILVMKRERVANASIHFERAKADFTRTYLMVLKELGISEQEAERWKMDKSGEFVEKIKEEK